MGVVIVPAILDRVVSVALGSPIRTETARLSLATREREREDGFLHFLHSPSESAPANSHFQELARIAFSTAASGWVL